MTILIPLGALLMAVPFFYFGYRHGMQVTKTRDGERADRLAEELLLCKSWKHMHRLRMAVTEAREAAVVFHQAHADACKRVAVLEGRKPYDEPVMPLQWMSVEP